MLGINYRYLIKAPPHLPRLVNLVGHKPTTLQLCLSQPPGLQNIKDKNSQGGLQNIKDKNSQHA